MWAPTRWPLFACLLLQLQLAAADTFSAGARATVALQSSQWDTIPEGKSATEDVAQSKRTAHVAGLYHVTSDVVHIGGLHGLFQDALAFYPSFPTDNSDGPAKSPTNMTFPLVSFSHGDMGGGWGVIAYSKTLRTLAAAGLVVLAHRSCIYSCGNEQYLDQLRVLQWAHDRQTATPAGVAGRVLRMINFNLPFGVAGHSTGGRSSIQSVSSHLRLPFIIGAALGYNPDLVPALAANVTTIPVAIFTGTDDHIEPKGSALTDFHALSTCNKVFADAIGENHLDPLSWPLGKHIYSSYAAAFLASTLDPSASHSAQMRAVIYSTCHGPHSPNGTLCALTSVGGYAKGSCTPPLRDDGDDGGDTHSHDGRSPLSPLSPSKKHRADKLITTAMTAGVLV